MVTPGRFHSEAGARPLLLRLAGRTLMAEVMWVRPASLKASHHQADQPQHESIDDQPPDF